MVKRPGVVTLIGVILLLQATFTLVGGIVALALNTQQRILDETGLTSSDLIATGIVSLVIGAIILVVALALMGGSRVGRTVVAVVAVLNVAFAGYVMFANHTGAYLFQGLLTVAISVFVLAALYSERADEFFESRT